MLFQNAVTLKTDTKNPAGDQRRVYSGLQTESGQERVFDHSGWEG